MWTSLFHPFFFPFRFSQKIFLPSSFLSDPLDMVKAHPAGGKFEDRLPVVTRVRKGACLCCSSCDWWPGRGCSCPVWRPRSLPRQLASLRVESSDYVVWYSSRLIQSDKTLPKFFWGDIKGCKKAHGTFWTHFFPLFLHVTIFHDLFDISSDPHLIVETVELSEALLFIDGVLEGQRFPYQLLQGLYLHYSRNIA